MLIFSHQRQSGIKCKMSGRKTKNPQFNTCQSIGKVYIVISLN